MRPSSSALISILALIALVGCARPKGTTGDTRDALGNGESCPGPTVLNFGPDIDPNKPIALTLQAPGGPVPATLGFLPSRGNFPPALIAAFAICLLIGAFEADNSFSTTVQRALVAMVVTLLVGLLIGAMAQKMLDENLKPHEEKPEISTKREGTDR